MATKEFEEYLEKRYYDQLSYYENASGKNKKKYKNFQWLLIILSTITTILAALPAIGNFSLQYVVVATSAFVTILTAGLKTFQYQELWVNYRSTKEQLIPEIYYYNFNVGDYGQEGVNKENMFVARVEQILSKEHDVWPVAKKLKDQAGQSQLEIDELQEKLSRLLKEKMNIQKPVPAEETINTEQQAAKADTVQPAETTNIEQQDMPTENTNEETEVPNNK